MTTPFETFTLPGLEAPAEIRVDRWGVPHIRAQSPDDAFRVQGFNAARDRLWQLDLWRKRGLGRLAADFGPGYLAQDRATRLFLYRGDREAEWAAYGTPRTRAVVEAFVSGLNGFIALTVARPDLLPPEFAAMGTRPEPWAPEDVVRIRSHALVRNVPSEVARARVLARADVATDALRKGLSPPHAPVIPEGVDASTFPDDLLDVLSLATAAVGFDPGRRHATRDAAWDWSRVDARGAVVRRASGPQPEPASEGSNNWAVAPARTATGRPILASDPHRVVALPSLRYVVHLTAPGLDVIGAGEPALPGIAIGHNGRAAFSLTIAPIDQEDLFVLDTHPDDPDLFRYADGWERIERVAESIPVRDGPDEAVVLGFTRHGPVICEDHARNKAYAVRTVWSEPGTAAYLASLAYLDAATPEAFGAALRHWSAPSVNQVYADVNGRIAWFVAGKAPVRPNWDGLLPVPGDGRYAWAGFHEADALPRQIDPLAGYVYSANEMNLPDGYPAEARKLGFEWLEPWRARRIRTVLAHQPRHALADSQALQGDAVSEPALRLAHLAATLAAPEDAEARAAIALLETFDGRLDADGAAAALVEVFWVHHLRPALFAALVPDAATRVLLPPGDVEGLLDRLESPRAPLDAPARDALLTTTLAAAWRDCAGRLGPDPATWAWGRLHHALLAHPLAPLGFAGRDVGPLPKGGAGPCVMHAEYDPETFRVTHGASFRMVLDVGAWDESVFINAPGQSGRPDSPHYADLAPTWAARGYCPLLYSRDAVDAATETVIVLMPGPAGA
ncbi:penicillin acylase family protein [uncultured Methylobacterium sp.]|uniref:penicillin acylase family protein n=1 Tax=uncultured Methylobacterium sp. TaxID=157278 RepID=UPI0035CB411A